MVISVSVAYTVVVCIAGTVVTDPIVVCVGIVVPVFFAVLTFTVLIINHICGLDYIVLISVLSGVAECKCRCASECDHDSGCDDRC